MGVVGLTLFCRGVRPRALLTGVLVHTTSTITSVDFRLDSDRWIVKERVEFKFAGKAMLPSDGNSGARSAPLYYWRRCTN